MKKYFKSIKFRLWSTFVLFAAVMLVILFVCQVLMLPWFYEYMKTRETTETAKTLCGAWNWEQENFKNYISQLADEHQMSIYVNKKYYDIFGDEKSFTYYSNRNGDISTTYSDRIAKQFEVMKDELLSSTHSYIATRTTENNKQVMIYISYVGTPDNIEGYIYLYNYLEPLGTTYDIIRYQFFISTVIILLSAVLVSVILANQVSRPIVNISKSATKLIDGEFNMQISKNEYDEISALKQNLNYASYEIAKTDTLRKDLMANISHDLRTPLTMIKAYAEMIRDLSGNNPEKREKHLQVIIDETDRLTALVTDILNLSKLQSGVSEMNPEVFDFSAHLEDIASRFNYLKETNGFEIALDIEDDIYIKADITRLEQVVYNMIHNAINYTGENKEVTVRLYHINYNTVRFEVSDSGEGIPEDKLPYIWDRYYKVNRSENHSRAVSGSGIGLSIVKSVLSAHNFKFGVYSKVGVGSTFWFESPEEKEDNSHL